MSSKRKNENIESGESENEELNSNEAKEQVYNKIETKVEILDILFHPVENNLIYLGLINGKLKM